MDTAYFQEAILIRRVEEKLLELFSAGKLNGTIHTCVGQEFSAIACAGQVEKNDYVISNHRCHGHYISYTKDYKSLIAEVMGKRTGACGGIGGSQHLFKHRFLSNGIQGGMVPVAAGLAMAQKLYQSNHIVMAFIGDGTLGEGVLYETMNIISTWRLPLLLVCENNYYAQSTSQSTALAGSIVDRAQSFGIATFQSDIWNLDQLFTNAKNGIDYVRNTSSPAFHVVNSYRLNPHSKGDDYRDVREKEKFSSIDPIHEFRMNNPQIYEQLLERIDEELDEVVREIEASDELSFQEYYFPGMASETKMDWVELPSISTHQSDLIYAFFAEEMKKNDKLLFIGEDVLFPYGGTFKISKDLSEKFPERVISTPISEAAITGVSNGLALAGYRPVLEIMFGDFVSLCIDQILNHASKFRKMYNHQVECPIVIRTPMGGGRGYGPTHSQTLDKLLLTIDNISVVALNSMIDPGIIYHAVIQHEKDPVIVIENKLDYAKKFTGPRVRQFVYEFTLSHRYPILRIRPYISQPTVTIVTYGGVSRLVEECIEPLFMEYDVKAEVIILTKIKPIDYEGIFRSVYVTKSLYVVEEGSMAYGVGSEVIATVSERMTDKIEVRRIASLSVPIPSNRNLEGEILVNRDRIIQIIGKNSRHA